MANDTGYPFRIVPFFYDYGFKVAFANDNPFSRKAIELLAGLKSPILRLEMMRNEVEAISIEGRSGFYDVICRDEQYRIFILEMQKDHFKYLPIRLMFYDFHYFNSLISKGRQGFKDIPPVICICVVEDKLYPGEENFVWEFMFRDTSTGKILSELAQVRLIELGKFPTLQNDFNSVKTDTDKLLWTMKYAHLIDTSKISEVPSFWGEPWMADVLAKLDLAKMDSEQRAMLDMSIVKMRMAHAQYLEELEEAKELGQVEGEKKGEKKGERKGEKKGVDKTLKVVKLFLQNKSPEEIARSLKLPQKEVDAIIQKFRELQ
jgi:predicted transposase/invertase (TIGR01784 family)